MHGGGRVMEAGGRRPQAVPAATDEGPGSPARPGEGAPTPGGRLARPARRRIVEALAGAPEGATVAALAERFGIHQNAVRKHLAALRAAGAVSAEPQAPSGRGRPSVRWRLAAEGGDPVAEGHRE